MFKDIITLVYVVETIDSSGYPSETITEYQVFANRKSVVRSEYYAALQTSLRPTNTFEIRQEEWDSMRHVVNNKEVYPTKLKYREAIYDIIRTGNNYKTGFIEVVCA